MKKLPSPFCTSRLSVELSLEGTLGRRLSFSLALSPHILLFSPTPQLVGGDWVPALPRTPRGPILVIPQAHLGEGQSPAAFRTHPPALC